MAANRPAGPRLILVGGFALGCVLLGAAYWRPTVHILWQAPLGLVLVISCMGKMTSR